MKKIRLNISNIRIHLFIIWLRNIRNSTPMLLGRNAKDIKTIHFATLTTFKDISFPTLKN